MIFRGSVFELRFLLSSGTDFSWVLALFRNMFLILSALLVLVIFWVAIPFENAFLASPRVLDSAHFQHVLWTSYQVRFLSDFVTLLEPPEARVGTTFENKTVPKIVSKKRDPLGENYGLRAFSMAPRDGASRAHNSNKKQLLELELLFEFVSMALASKNC